MTTVIKDEVGVEMAGPDSPALAAAKARDVGGEAYLKYTDECRANGRHPLNHEDWASRRQPGNGLKVGSLHATSIPAGEGMVAAEKLGLHARQIEKRDLAMRAGSAGAVSREQAGILPTGGISVSSEMVERAQTVATGQGLLLERDVVRAMLEAALRG